MLQRRRATARRSSRAGASCVVEDDVRNIFALTSVLEPKGAKVEIARNGREALDAPRSGRRGVDLVLMDIMMPEMDGLEAMREIRKQPELDEAADHRADRQGDDGRPRAVPRGRRQRLHRQAARRREAALAGARLDAANEAAASTASDIELAPRCSRRSTARTTTTSAHYAEASLQRRARRARCVHFGCATLSRAAGPRAARPGSVHRAAAAT